MSRYLSEGSRAGDDAKPVFKVVDHDGMMERQYARRRSGFTARPCEKYSNLLGRVEPGFRLAAGIHFRCTGRGHDNRVFGIGNRIVGARINRVLHDEAPGIGQRFTAIAILRQGDDLG